MKATFRLAWDRFNLIASIIGDVQGRVISIAFYFTILAPFGALSRLFSDPLRLEHTSEKNAHWLERQPVPEDLDSARLQG